MRFSSRRTMRGWLLAALVACPALAASAQDGGTPPAQPRGVLTKKPVLLHAVRAVYPPEALAARRSGTVVLEVDLGADGKVTAARVVQSAGHGFDEAALAALRQFAFSPAEIDGKPAPVRIRYRYHFELPPPPPPKPTVRPVNFAGEVLERGTRAPLSRAVVTVRVPNGPLSATTEVDGTFELRGVPDGTWNVEVRAQGHARYQTPESFRKGHRTEVRYYVRKTPGSFEVVVRAPKERKDVTQIALQREEIRLLPGTQGDAFKVIQDLPGVARAPYGAGLLVVRGGKSWDTRVYVDGTQVPMLFHFGGLYATFNADLLQEITFEPGNFGVEHGRSIGGLVVGRTRTPSRQGIHGHVDLNLVDASALLEAPLGKSWSFAVAGRRSYIDALLPLVVPKDTLTFTVAPRYYDFQAKLEHHREGSGARSWIELFGSNDRLGLVLNQPSGDPEGRSSIDTLLAYGRLVLHDERPVAPRLRNVADFSAGLDAYDFSVGSDIYNRVTEYPLSLRDQLTFRWIPHRLTLDFGLDLFALPYRVSTEAPPFPRPGQIPSPFLSDQLTRYDNHAFPTEPGAFVEATFQPTSTLRFVAGVRGDWDSTMHRGWVDPRLAAFWQVAKHLRLKAAAGLFHQPPDYQRGLLTPKFGNPHLLPEAASQYSIGADGDFGTLLHFDVDLYWLERFHLAQAVPASPPGSPPTPPYESIGTGRAYGLELLLRHDFGKHFFGWIAYSLSKAEVTDARTGAPRRSSSDQPEHLILVGSYHLPAGFIAGLRVQWTSGALTTPYVGAIYDANANRYTPLPGDPLSERLPAFFQADLRVDKVFTFDTWKLDLYLDVQNVTNRSNVEGTRYNFDYTRRAYTSGLPILPILGARGDF